MATPYCFGRFTLDPAERRLFADGAPVPLGRTDFRLLLALVENAGTLVAKQNLMSLVGGRFGASDNVLYIHINTLRKTLGTDCIESQQGRGYRFVAPVRRMEPRKARPGGGIRAGNLPSLWTDDLTAGPTRLIGRSEQLRMVSDLLAQSRLVTLIGPGGVGKTRLALRAAQETSPNFSDGVWLVELASLKDPELVPAAIASVLGVKIGATATPLDTLQRYLAPKSLLLVLDNCEHVLAASAQIAEGLLAAAPNVKILATSREALSCFGERILEVPPLAVPSEDAMPAAAMRSTASVELFIERALNADANFQINDDALTAAASICRRVDGLPLAIEMVASRAASLGLEALDMKLGGSLKAWLRARHTAPARHSTLRATLEWSHGLLSTDEQAVLRRLAVFAGSFIMSAAENVAGDDAIPKERVFEHVGNLVRKSMLAMVRGSQPRYHLLETTRDFMLERLEASGEAHATRRRHAGHILSTLETAGCELETTSDVVWLERYAPLLDDLRAALDWAMEQDSHDAVALAGASWPLWRQLSLRTEGRQRLSAAAARLMPDTPPALDARLRCGLGFMLSNTTALKAAQEEIERAVVTYRALGDRPNLGAALTALAFPLFILNRTGEADQAIQEALSLLEPAGWLRTLANAYNMQLVIETIRGRFDMARIAQSKAEHVCRMVGAERIALAVAANLVQHSLEKHDVDCAISTGRDLAERLRDTTHSDLYGFVLGLLAVAFTAHGDLNEALAAAREAAPLLRDEGSLFWLFDHLALLAALGERAKDAALVAGYANAMYNKIDRAREPMGRHAMERVANLLDDALADDEIAHLQRLGAQLSEEQAASIALGS